MLIVGGNQFGDSLAATNAMAKAKNTIGIEMALN